MDLFIPVPRLCRIAAKATLATLAAMGGIAGAEIIDITWDAGGRFERAVTIAPGKFIEVCDKLPAGMKVRWDFRATAPLDFNVHYHVDKEVVFPAKLSAVAAAKDTLTTQVTQDYCWTWSNKSTGPATVKVTLLR